MLARALATMVLAAVTHITRRLPVASSGLLSYMLLREAERTSASEARVHSPLSMLLTLASPPISAPDLLSCTRWAASCLTSSER